MTEKIASEFSRLPMYPQLTRSEQENIVQAVKECLTAGRKDAVSQGTTSNRRLTVRPFCEGSSSQRTAAAFNMTVYEIDPTRDERWDEFLQNHPDASIFHTRGWLEALRRTYGYQPVAFTLSPPGRP